MRDTSEFGVFGVEIPLKVGSPTKARFKFEPPTDIEFVGGHSYGTLVAPFVVDMAITMPAVRNFIFTLILILGICTILCVLAKKLILGVSTSKGSLE